MRCRRNQSFEVPLRPLWGYEKKTLLAVIQSEKVQLSADAKDDYFITR